MAGASQASYRAGTGTISLDSEEGREFLQQRTALFGKAGFFITAGFFVALNLLVAAGARSAWVPATLVTGSNLIHLGTVAVMGAIWWAACHVQLGLRTLLFLDAGGVAACSLTYSLFATSRTFGADTHFPMVLAYTHTLLARSIIIPSAPKRTMVVAAVSIVPIAATAVLVIDRQIAAGRIEPSARMFHIGLVWMWALCAPIVATITSRVIYALSRRVEQAQRLGQYTLIEKIGEGGMGAVYRASHAMLRRPTAIKLLPPDKAGEETVERFEREVQHTARLTHPNTIAIYDYGRTPDGVFYYAMEYLDGIDLEELVDRHGPQPPSRVLHVLKQVCGALAEAHAAGLIHRDVKPANVILCTRGGVPDVVKVVDFGLVKQIAKPEGAGVTRADQITGTPLYLSPEAITAPDDVDARSDLYAVGAIGYWLLTGKHVFDAKTFIEVCSLHLTARPTPPSERLGTPLPDDVESILLACLEKQREARPKDADALLAALSSCRDADEWGRAQATAWWAEHPRPREDRRAPPTRPQVRRAMKTMSIDLSQRSEATRPEPPPEPSPGPPRAGARDDRALAATRRSADR